MVMRELITFVTVLFGIGIVGNMALPNICPDHASYFCSCDVTEPAKKTPLKMCRLRNYEDVPCGPCPKFFQDHINCTTCPDNACLACSPERFGIQSSYQNNSPPTNVQSIVYIAPNSTYEMVENASPPVNGKHFGYASNDLDSGLTPRGIHYTQNKYSKGEVIEEQSISSTIHSHGQFIYKTPDNVPGYSGFKWKNADVDGIFTAKTDEAFLTMPVKNISKRAPNEDSVSVEDAMGEAREGKDYATSRKPSARRKHPTRESITETGGQRKNNVEFGKKNGTKHKSRKFKSRTHGILKGNLETKFQNKDRQNVSRVKSAGSIFDLTDEHVTGFDSTNGDNNHIESQLENVRYNTVRSNYSLSEFPWKYFTTISTSSYNRNYKIPKSTVLYDSQSQLAEEFSGDFLGNNTDQTAFGNGNSEMSLQVDITNVTSAKSVHSYFLEEQPQSSLLPLVREENPENNSETLGKLTSTGSQLLGWSSEPNFPSNIAQQSAVSSETSDMMQGQSRKIERIHTENISNLGGVSSYPHKGESGISKTNLPPISRGGNFETGNAHFRISNGTESRLLDWSSAADFFDYVTDRVLSDERKQTMETKDVKHFTFLSQFDPRERTRPSNSPSTFRDDSENEMEIRSRKPKDFESSLLHTFSAPDYVTEHKTVESVTSVMKKCETMKEDDCEKVNIPPVKFSNLPEGQSSASLSRFGSEENSDDGSMRFRASNGTEDHLSSWISERNLEDRVTESLHFQNETSEDATDVRRHDEENTKGFGIEKESSIIIRFTIMESGRLPRATYSPPMNYWCTIHDKERNGNLKCTIWSYKKICELQCHENYSYSGQSRVTSMCSRSKNTWVPGLGPCERGQRGKLKQEKPRK